MTSVYAPDTSPSGPPPPGPQEPRPLDRGLAMFGYLCLFFTVFFAGAPALVMVVLAYARRAEADPITRTHLRFQIRTFWWCFWLTVLAVLALVAALVLGVAGMTGAGAPAAAPGLETIHNVQPTPAPLEQGLVAVSGLNDWESLPGNLRGAADRLQHAPLALVALIASGVLSLVSILWTFLAALWGGLKLAAGRPIGALRRDTA